VSSVCCGKVVSLEEVSIRGTKKILWECFPLVTKLNFMRRDSLGVAGIQVPHIIMGVNIIHY
jgi:hypothetical protein